MSIFNTLGNIATDSVINMFSKKDKNKSSGSWGDAYAAAAKESAQVTKGFVKQAMTMAAEGRSGTKTNLPTPNTEESKYTKDQQEIIRLYNSARSDEFRKALVQQLKANGNNRLAFELEVKSLKDEPLGQNIEIEKA